MASTQLGFNPPATGHQPTVSDDLRRVGTREAYRILSDTFCSFWTHLGAQLEPKLASKLGQVGLKIDILLRSNFEFVSEGILEPLGLDFGSRLGFEIEHKNDLKISSAKNAKFDSRCSGSSIFDVPGSSKIDQKTMPKGLRDKTSS